MEALAQLRLVDEPMAGMYPITKTEANSLLVGWQHRLGEIHRLWRELCGPLWGREIAVSYSKNSMHKGDLYRFDGWERIRTDAGSSGGGTWSAQRQATDAVTGSKSLWIWRYGNDSKREKG